ncbi:MAG: serine hydrolase domain-containing protein [Panacagrimonas sp.]
MSIERLTAVRPANLRKVMVPRDLSPVRAIDADEAPAAQAGLGGAAVQGIWDAVETLYRSGAYPAVSFCLQRRGERVLNRSLGHAQGNGPDDSPDLPKRLATPDTPIMISSASKAITAALVHLLAEEGGIELDRPVAHYLPAFGAQGKQRITIAEMLSHRGGIPFIRVPKAERRIELLADWERCLALLYAASPVNVGWPAYHAYSSGFILGELIQRVTGRPLREYLDRRLRQPLGMRHFTYGLPAEHRAAVARHSVAGAPVRFPISVLLPRLLMGSFDALVESHNGDSAMNSVLPSGNLHATAAELTRFYQMLLDKGMYQGRQVMQPQTVARLIRPVGRMALDRTLMLPMRYSEGLILGADPYGMYGPRSGRAFGHLGFTNILGWADPDRAIACSLIVTGKAILGTHLRPFFGLLNRIAQECEPSHDAVCTAPIPEPPSLHEPCA